MNAADRIDELSAEIDSLRAELAATREDADRLAAIVERGTSKAAWHLPTCVDEDCDACSWRIIYAKGAPEALAAHLVAVSQRKQEDR